MGANTFSKVQSFEDMAELETLAENAQEHVSSETTVTEEPQTNMEGTTEPEKTEE